MKPTAMNTADHILHGTRTSLPRKNSPTQACPTLPNREVTPSSLGMRVKEQERPRESQKYISLHRKEMLSVGRRTPYPIILKEWSFKSENK